jgi:hypothetical protein
MNMPVENDSYPSQERYPAAFDEAVRMLRTGSRFLEVEEAVSTGCHGLVNVSAAQVVAEAQRFLKNLHTLAFEASVAAFERGESDNEVIKKIIKCDFHPFDAEIVAARAKAKAEENSRAEESNVDETAS